MIFSITEEGIGSCLNLRTLRLSWMVVKKSSIKAHLAFSFILTS
jgi:hypothetical protein